MKKIYGNHVGIVISRDDPENRGRCQIFIPHISNTLYKDWNDKLKDIDFENVSTIPPNIIKRLRETLPWAECASPIFGGGSGATTNEATRVTTPNPSEVVAPVDLWDTSIKFEEPSDVIPLEDELPVADDFETEPLPTADELRQQ